MTVFASWPLALSREMVCPICTSRTKQRLRPLAGHLGLRGPLLRRQLGQPAQVARLVAGVVLGRPGRRRAGAVGDLVVEATLHPVGPRRCDPGGDVAVGPRRDARVVGLDRRPVVRRDRGPPHEPRLGPATEVGDHPSGLRAQHPGRVATGERLDLAVHVLGQVEVGVGPAAERVPGLPVVVGAGHPLRPARRHVVQRGLRGAVDRLLAVPVEVLADQRGLVPRPLQHRGDGAPVAEGLETERLLVAVDVVVVGVLAGEEARSRRAAERVRREGVLEGQPPPLQQPLHVGHEAQVVPAHVVGLDHEHVRALLPGLLHRRRLGRDQRLAGGGVSALSLLRRGRTAGHERRRGRDNEQRRPPATHPLTLCRCGHRLVPHGCARGASDG